MSDPSKIESTTPVDHQYMPKPFKVRFCQMRREGDGSRITVDIVRSNTYDKITAQSQSSSSGTRVDSQKN